MSMPQAKGIWSYLNWANRITLFRFMLIAPFVVLLRHQQDNDSYRRLALVIFVIMGVSDFVDGFLARRFKLKTELGAILDPLADKIMIICAAVLLAADQSSVTGARLPDWVVIAIVGKDLWVIVGFVVVFLIIGRVHVEPTITGKLTTAAQLLMVCCILINPELDQAGLKLGLPAGLPLGFWATRVLWWLVTMMCVLAALHYTYAGIGVVAENEKKQGLSTQSTQRNAEEKEEETDS
jgi:cardiolipin synthase